nr:hypothetical protein [Rhodococcus sp. 06-156-3b]
MPAMDETLTMDPPPRMIVDAQGQFRDAYSIAGPEVFVVRPDGYLGHRGSPDTAAVVGYLKGTFA